MFTFWIEGKRTEKIRHLRMGKCVRPKMTLVERCIELASAINYFEFQDYGKALPIASATHFANA